MKARPPIRWFWLWWGPDHAAWQWRRLTFGFIARPDLMTRPEDQGRYVLAVFAFDWSFGPYLEALENVGWRHARWHFRLTVRSDISEIAQRLADAPASVPSP